MCSSSRAPEHQARSGAPETRGRGHADVRGYVQQSGGENDPVAARRTGHREPEQFHQARALRRQAVHRPGDVQRDARSGRRGVHVPGLPLAIGQAHQQRNHAQRLP